MTLGSLIKENANKDIQTDLSWPLISHYTDDYYYVFPKQQQDVQEGHLVRFNEETNEFESVYDLHNLRFSNNNDGLYGCGTQCIFYNDNKKILYLTYTNNDTLKGFNYDGHEMYFSDNFVFTDKILNGYNTYNRAGDAIVGTMPNNGKIEIIPSANEQTFPAGYTSGVTATGDKNLIPQNIKEGVSIFGVEGVVTQENKLTPAEYDTALQLCDDIKGNPAPKEGHIYGVRKPLNGVTLERTDDARGLTAEATHDGHPENVTNDFNTLEPWASIKSFNYDSSKEEIIAWYGDNDFTFTPEDPNINVFTRIPRLWYKRYKDEEYEYWKIADYAAEGFIEYSGSSPARYSISGSTKAPRSISGNSLLLFTDLKDFRNSCTLLGGYNSLFDIWTVNIIQMLYLIEYANADSQSMLGNGVYSSGGKKTGGCDSLGMMSGSLNDTNSTSIIYRGFEDIFGNAADMLDGLIWNTDGTYDIKICENWTEYGISDNYKSLSYASASKSGYINEFGLDETYPLIMMPITTVDTMNTSFTKDNFNNAYSYKNCVIHFGGSSDYYGHETQMGLFCMQMLTGNASYYDGARFLLHKIS